MPKREDWYSWLKDGNEVTPENYKIMQNIWNTQNCSTMADLLLYYNLQDIDPFFEAIKNFSDHYCVFRAGDYY